MMRRNATRLATRSRTRSCSRSRKDAAAKWSPLIGFLTALLSFMASSGAPTSSTGTASGSVGNSTTSTTATSVISTLMDFIALLVPGCKHALSRPNLGRLQTTDGGLLEWHFVPGEKPEAMSWSARPRKPFRNSRGSTHLIGCRLSSRKSKGTPKGQSPSDRSQREGMM